MAGVHPLIDIILNRAYIRHRQFHFKRRMVPLVPFFGIIATAING
jgi:hypothetical protein